MNPGAEGALECGAPVPPFIGSKDDTRVESGRGLPQSKALARNQSVPSCPNENPVLAPLAQDAECAHLGRMIRNSTAILSLFLLVSAASAIDADPLAVERTVRQMVASKDVTVVHFWAPWCSNCITEQRDDGWANFMAQNPGVRFVFIEAWNDGKDSREALAKYNIGAQSNLTILVHPAPRRGEGRMRTFLGLPVTWLPSTWVFREGRLSYAFNHGEIRFPVLQQLVTDAGADW